MEAELKPCPFCGCDKPTLKQYNQTNNMDPQYFVHCPSCGADGPWQKHGGSAETQWNRRVIIPIIEGGEHG